LGTELKIADDGEILLRGRHVFVGYLNDSAATAESLDREGWLHSGDIGEIDHQGYVRITDRKKDLIITSGGINVSPQAIESKLKSIPAISQAVLVGDRRKYLTALLCLDPEQLMSELQKAGSPAMDIATASVCPEFRGHIQLQIDQINRQLTHYQAIKKFTILPRECSIASGELTPTMKLRRKFITEKYATEINAMYE
jgi:long-chain acyl-CoA synthetase